MKRGGRPYRGIRVRMVVMAGLLLLGSGWLALRLLLAEHDVVAAIAVALLVASALGNRRASRAAGSVADRHGTIGTGRPWLPEGMSRRRVPEVHLTDDVEPPRPKLGAPGSLN